MEKETTYPERHVSISDTLVIGGQHQAMKWLT